MTTNDVSQNEPPNEAGSKVVTFQCQSCGRLKRIEEMRVLTRFFPLLVICNDCEQKML